MSATLAKRRDPFAVPRPGPCPCGGTRPSCLGCAGTGTARVWFRLKAARSLEYRRVIFQPVGAGMGLLSLTTRASEAGSGRFRTAAYQVAEFGNAFGGRSFRVLKAGADETYRAIVYPDGTGHCDCKGSTYEGAERADRRAHYCGDRRFDSAGCNHLDALRALVANGWFDAVNGAAA